MAKYVSSPVLNILPAIKHGFFTRMGGVSNGIYSSLNCGTYSHDAAENVFRNRKKACYALSNKAILIEIHQTHSNIVHTYDGNNIVPDADGIVTNQSNIALSIVTADCAPVLFADAKAGVIGAAHAGWQGAHSGIIENTIKAMCGLGADRDNIHASIGPCIAQTSYEVGPDFYDKIDDDQYFSKSKKQGHYLFNLEHYICDKLRISGIKNSAPVGLDTYDKNNDFFSYRRKTHLGEKDYGRQISIILQN